MITIIFRAVINPEKDNEFNEILPILTQSANTEPKSTRYTFYQSLEKTNELILFEQWETQQALDAHLGRLETLLGEKAENSTLPKKLLDCFAETEDILYKTS